MSVRRPATLAVLLVLCATLNAAAEPPVTSPDEGYAMQRAVIGAGGPHSTAAGYALEATGGQPAAGRITAADLAIDAGFLYACLAAAPSTPSVSISKSGNDVLLSWSPAAENVHYQVWVSTAPYFDPDNPGAVTPVITELASYLDLGAAASLTNHFYVVRGVNVCGVASGDSLRRGEFTFGLTPGSG